MAEPIAAGGVGQVWRATDLWLDREVAVKLLRPGYADHPDTLERFRAEAKHAGSLTHDPVHPVLALDVAALAAGAPAAADLPRPAGTGVPGEPRARSG